MSSGTTPHGGLTHLKKYDVKDSNVELIGTDIDHKVKYKSAQTEPAWKSVGTAPGLWVWRIEQFEVVARPREEYGTFYEGDSYIVLHSIKAGQQDDKLVHDIHFWLGKETSQDEAGTAAYKTVELDEFLHGTATQHREVQGSESTAFSDLFPNITVRHGGVQTGFRHIEASKPQNTLLLFRITKAASATTSGAPSAKTSTIVRQVEPTWQSLVDDDCFLLDLGGKVYIWQGRKCSPVEKAKAAQIAHDMTLTRQVETEVVAQTDSRAHLVLEALGGTRESPIPSSSAESSAPTPSTASNVRTLYRISDASGSLRFEKVKSVAGSGDMPLRRSDLDSKDVFLLDDHGRQLWVWQGQEASCAERTGWLNIAQAYLRSLSGEGKTSAHSLPISKVVEGFESTAFTAALEADI